MWDRFAPRLRRMIFAALEEAGGCGASQASDLHLLTVIARDDASAAAFILDHASIDRATLVEPDRRGVTPASRRADSLASFTLHVLDVASNESEEFGDKHVGTEHFLAALTQIARGAAFDAITSHGFDRAKFDAGRNAWIAGGMHRRRAAPSRNRTLFRPLRKIARTLSLAWRVYAKLSLGHPNFWRNPYPLYAKLRSRWPVREDPIAPVWVVTRYADVAAVMRDPRFCKDPFLANSLPPRVREQLQLPIDANVPVIGEPMAMLFLDPPRHTKIRGLFNRGFSPRALEQLRPRIQQIAGKRIEMMREQAEPDVMRDLAFPLPTIVIAELMGFPPEDYPRLKKWSDDFAAALTINPAPEQQARSDQSREEMREYFDEVVANLKKTPGHNLISTLLRDDADDGLLTRQEFFANSALLLAAGHETTSNLIGNGVLALLRNPKQLQLLRDDPSLINAAVDEMLRYDSPVQWTSRIAAEDVTLSDGVIPRGAVVLASLGSANRDPAQFANPDAFDIGRADNKHIAFGQGIHYCIGATLAKMEAAIAIGTLIARFPKLRLKSKRIKWQRGVIFRGPKSLRVRVD